MKRTRNRPGRKDRRWIALLLIVAASLAIAPVALAAETGGASPVASAGPSSADLSFSPFRYAGATWYGPGLYGRQTACGQTLQPQTVGVAHRDLPCGTAVKFVYRGRELVTRVIDRGPYANGSDWDLTNGARRALGFDGSGRIRYAVALSYARADR
ncbi:MAG TPA: septal ring lytic transglycosylase RlpA family protein [Solirubrobacterales bacterium]|jgi:rare lipoprotein A (peptidoglycan hydrolase)|nr:septal ring lytic transglycosylase RlpA family protein [Solirubrobacterales bacterium]